MLLSLPTDPSGLAGGDLWIDGDTLKQTPGGVAGLFPTYAPSILRVAMLMLRIDPAGLNLGDAWLDGGTFKIFGGGSTGNFSIALTLAQFRDVLLNLPTDPLGLPSGEPWMDGGTLKMVFGGLGGDESMALFFAVEIDTSVGGASYSLPEGWGAQPWGVMDGKLPSIAATNTVRASDVGYRTLPTDAGGLQVYPGMIQQAFAIDRRIPLDPTSASAAAAWGSVTLANPNNFWDALAASQNCDGRHVRIFAGRKTLDGARGIDLDPSYAALAPLWKGLAKPWFLSDTTLTVPLRDASYWFERPVQTTLYLGTGTLEGTSDLTGKPKPKTRGGSVNNVTPVLVDPAFLIYQYSDAAGSVQQVYEGGAAVFTAGGDVADLYVGSTTAGQYRTNNAHGLFQMGSAPQKAITADVTGAFAVAGAQTNPITLLRYLISEDLATPSDLLNTASFTAVAAAFSGAAGVYFDDNTVQGVDAIEQLLISCGAVLYPKRDGTLNVMLLRAPAGPPIDTWDTSNLVSLTPRQLPATLDPPTYLWRVYYQQNYTVQSTDIATLVTAARKSYLATPGRLVTTTSSAIAGSYSRPNAPNPIGGALLSSTDAQAVSDGLAGLWSARRRLYDAVLPIDAGITRDLGDVVLIRYPMDNLAGGQVGMIVGEQFSSANSTITYQVLI